MRNLRSLTRDGTHGPLQWKQSLNHWTTKEVPSNFVYVILKEFFLNLFIFGCAGSSLLQAGSLSRSRERGLLLSVVRGLLTGSTGSKHPGFRG